MAWCHSRGSRKLGACGTDRPRPINPPCLVPSATITRISDLLCRNAHTTGANFQSSRISADAGLPTVSISSLLAVLYCFNLDRLRCGLATSPGQDRPLPQVFDGTTSGETFAASTHATMILVKTHRSCTPCLMEPHLRDVRHEPLPTDRTNTADPQTLRQSCQTLLRATTPHGENQQTIPRAAPRRSSLGMVRA